MYCAGVLTLDGGFMDSSSSRTKVYHRAVGRNGHSYDVLDVQKQGSKDSVKLYSNVDIPFKHYLN